MLPLKRISALARPAARSLRLYSDKSPLQLAFTLNDEDDEEKRYRTEKNPVIPNVENLQSRWSTMDAAAQDDVIAYLEDKSRGDWHEISGDEKRALWWIYFGPWGPRAQGAEKSGRGYTVYAGLVGGVVAGLVGYKVASDRLTNERSE